MTQQAYRNAVRSIRWTPDKRAEIEARLREPIHSPPKREPAQQDIKHADVKRMEEYKMKQRRIRRGAVIGAVAALLAIGAAAAAIAGWKHQNADTVTWEDGTVLHLTTDEADLPAQRLYLQGDLENLIMPVDTGWYYYQPLVDDNAYIKEHKDKGGPLCHLITSAVWFSGGRYALYYADIETGMRVPVCASPSCLHDGSTFCTASTYAYDHGYLEYYDGYLYTVTNKYQHPENHNENSLRQWGNAEDSRQVLLRYAPDGTAITELCDFGTGYGDRVSLAAIHRGYVFCIVQSTKTGETTEDAILHQQKTFTSGGWQLWGYELAAGKMTCLYDAVGASDVNHVNKTPSGLLAIGDYIYFDRNTGDWSGSPGLWRISLLTGKAEQLTGEFNGIPVLSQTHMLYTYRLPKQNMSEAERLEYRILDLETREETAIGVKDETMYEILYMDENYLYGIHIGDENYNSDFDQWEINTYLNGTEYMLYIYDYDGNLVKKVPTGYPHWNAQKEWDEETRTNYEATIEILGIRDGQLYIHVSAGGDTRLADNPIPESKVGIWYCGADELINSEKPEWKFAYSYETEVIGNAE